MRQGWAQTSNARLGCATTSSVLCDRVGLDPPMRLGRGCFLVPQPALFLVTGLGSIPPMRGLAVVVLLIALWIAQSGGPDLGD